MVLNIHFSGVLIALPAKSLTPCVTITEYNLEGDKGDEGLRTAVSTSGDRIVEGSTLLKLSFSLIVAPLSVEASIGSLNLTEISTINGIFVALLAGKTLTILGGVVSAADGTAAISYVLGFVSSFAKRMSVTTSLLGYLLWKVEMALDS